MMKYCLFAIVALASFSVLSCGDDDETIGGGVDGGVSIVFSSDTAYFAKSGGQSTVKITTNASPVSAESKASWVSVVSVAVGDPSVLTLRADVNEGYAERSSVITVTCGQSQKDVYVLQSPADLLTPDEDTETNYVLQPYNLNWQGSTINVNFQTNGAPDITFPWWIKEAGTTKKDGYGVNMQFRILGNYGNERKGDITFKLGEESFSCQIVQGRTGFVFSDVDKSASDVAAMFRCGWTFSNCGSVSSVADFDDELADSVLSCGINIIRIPFLRDSVSTDVALVNLKNAVKAVTSRKVNGEGAFAIVSLSNEAGVMRRIGSRDTSFVEFSDMWSLIADALADCDYHVLFEAYDEISAAGVESYGSAYGMLNQAFVNAVRRSGGNNYKRCLVIPGGNQEAGVYMAMPADEAENSDRFMTSFSFFRPADYVKPNFTKKFWGGVYQQETEDWSSSFAEDDIKQAFSDVHSKLWRVPIILNSFGTVVHKELDGDAYSDCEAQYVRFVAEAAKNESFIPIVFDDGICGQGAFGVFSPTDKSLRTQRRAYLKSYIEGAGFQYAGSKK